MRLIDAEELERLFYEQVESGATDLFDAFEDALQDAQTVDAVAVVRCKDCVYWREAVTNDKGFLICPASGMEITESDFCSYGEREENNGVD